MSTCKIIGASAHRFHWLFSASLALALGLSAQVAGAQPLDEEAGEPDESMEPTEGEAMPAEATPAETAPAETAPAADAGEIPASYSDWFRDMTDKAHKPFEFHGYFRSGFGINGKGGKQEAFQAPTTPVKYRLGNETESYGELVFVNNWLNPERDTDSAWFKTQLLLTFVTFNNQNFDNDLFTIREAYAQAGNVIKSMPDLKFWAGQRYYRRHDIHINDFFHFSESGYGGGVEDLRIGDLGKMAIAYFGNSDSNFNPDPVNSLEYGRIVENNLELRMYDFAVPGGTGIAALKLSYARGQIEADDALPELVQLANVPGFLVSLFHVRNGFMGGYNKFSVQFGYGGSSDIESPLFFKAPSRQLKDSMQILVTESAQINLSDKITAMGALVFRFRKKDEIDTFDPNPANWIAEEANDLWFSAGIRPIYHFTKYTALAAEAGVDWVQWKDVYEENTTYSGPLFKLSVAPQIRTGEFFWARPTIRLYATAAYWTDDLKNLPDDPATPGNEEYRGVGGRAHVNDNFGMAFGVQAESWW
jgi:maltoporin